MQLDHFTIRTASLAETRAFFVDLFDLEEKPRPAAIHHIPGHWLYHKNAPIVHLIGDSRAAWTSGASAIDHVGIRLTDHEKFRSKLEERRIRYSLMDIPELGERRIFFHAPGGALIETVFPETTP